MKLTSILAAAAFLVAAPAFAQTPAAGRAATPGAQSTTPAASASAVGAPNQTTAPSAQTVDPAKVAAIRKLLTVTNSGSLGDDIVQSLTAQVKQAAATKISDPTRLNAFMDAFAKNYATRVSASQINDAEIAIYSNHLSLEDIQAIVAFYQSPAGQHVMNEIGKINQETMSTANGMARPGAIDTLKGMTNDYPEISALIPGNNPTPSNPSVSPTTPTQPGAAPSLRPIPAPTQ